MPQLLKPNEQVVRQIALRGADGKVYDKVDIYEITECDISPQTGLTQQEEYAYDEFIDMLTLMFKNYMEYLEGAGKEVTSPHGDQA